MRIPRIVQLVPFDGIGGVETAVRSIGHVEGQPFELRIAYIFPAETALGKRLALFNPLPFFAAARNIVRGGADVLVMSLWRSSAVGIAAKLMHPRLRLVTFLHNSRDAHFADFVLTRLGIALSDEVWGDSNATMQGRSRMVQKRTRRVISFVTRRFEPANEAGPQPRFIFWGRIGLQKNLGRAIRLFAQIRKRYPDATFDIWGPDCGSLAGLRSLSADLGIEESVRFLGSASPEQIVTAARNASFYLQTSDYEGMAMSVMEAMQLGLVPVVTPVGEIANYCRDGFDAVIVEDDSVAVDSLLTLLQSDAVFRRMRANAIATWKGYPLHRESILDACRAMCSREH